ncbi:MAG TPA: hypothetical protein VFA64_14880 [Hyphomicrobiaceae bacterium]|nr:hypothetical protein [Hyphomicrobiaceae bacterium]
MTRSLTRARRILALQEQLHRVEHWRLLELQHRAAELDRERQELIAALNDDDALAGLFLDATARRLVAIARGADDVARQEQLQGERLAEQAMQVACAERLEERVSLEARRESEKKALGEVIEAAVGRANASSPQD